MKKITKNNRIAKLENDVAMLKTDNQILHYTITELKQRIYDLEVRLPLPMQPYTPMQPWQMPITSDTTTPTKVETHNYAYGHCCD
jgi:hypothetical protein